MNRTTHHFPGNERVFDGVVFKPDPQARHVAGYVFGLVSAASLILILSYAGVHWSELTRPRNNGAWSALYLPLFGFFASWGMLGLRMWV